MSPLRRRLRRLRFALVGLLSGIVIVFAVVVALARLALPWLAEHPERVAAWLSERAGRSVTIDRVESSWSRSGPRLMLDGLVLGPGQQGEPALALAHAEIAINLYAAFQRNRAWNEFRLVGLDLALERAGDGTWQVRGIDLGNSASGGGSMGALGAIVLVDLDLRLRDHARDIDLAFAVPELRVVNLGRITRVLGQVGLAGSTSPPFELVADIDLDAVSGNAWLGAHDIDLAEAGRAHAAAGLSLQAGHGDVAFWGRWSAGVVDDIRARVDVRDATLVATTVVDGGTIEVAPRMSLDRLAFVARWQREGVDWTFDLADGVMDRRGETSSDARVRVERRGGDDARYRVAASGLAIEPLGSLAMLPVAVPASLRSWLYQANPKGTLVAADLDWQSPEDFRIDARVDGLVAQDARKFPGVDALDLRVHGDADAVLLEVPAQTTRIDYPYAFPAAFEFTRMQGDIVAWRDGADWHVESPRLDIESAHYAIDVRGGAIIEAGGGEPVLDVSALVARADVVAAKGFWPIRSMSPNARGWLDRALVGGVVSEGRVVFRGDLDDWPFREPTGRFEARADLAGLDLAFLPDWPHGENLDVVARFINNGMQASVTKGTSKGLVIDRADATIADFGESVLDLDIGAHGGGAALLDYLRATPIGTTHADALRGLVLGGEGKTALVLKIPLKQNDALTLDGSVDLVDSALAENTWGLDLGKANGRVHITRSGVSTEALKVSVEGRPATLALAIGSATSRKDMALEASLRAVLPVATVFARVPDIAPAFAHFPGEAEWQVALAIGSAGATPRVPTTLTVSSDLGGIAIDLPAPLGKPAEVRQPFALDLEIPPLGKPFQAMLGEVVRIHGRLPGAGESLAARLDFGMAANGDVPAQGILVGGHADTLDLGGWMTLFGSGSGTGGHFRGLALDVDDLLLGGRHFEKTRFVVDPANDATTVRFEGAAIDGDIRIPAGSDLARAGITAQMKRLHWPDAPPGQESAPAALSGIAPASLPPLHLWVGELRLGAANFGEARFESWPTPDGMHVDRLETESANFDMRASGQWTGSATENRSHLVIDMTAQNLGGMLDAFGFAGVIDGGKTLARIDAQWPGPPSAFALAGVDGTLEIGVDKGRILEVNPGAGGRLFGLLSLTEIPRRLSLDFSDLFKSGMSFNEIKGRFTLRDGNAFTEDLHIDSPAADISISGRTGLRSRDYDQQMVVTPRAGAALPVVGAIAGGPVGAAAGLVVQGLIGKQINQVARSRYQVGGSWDKPVITLLGREKTPGRAAPKADATTPGRG